MEKYEVVVIGGGAAGICAAISQARSAAGPSQAEHWMSFLATLRATQP